MTRCHSRTLSVVLAALLCSPCAAAPPEGLIAVASLNNNACPSPSDGKEAPFAAPLAAIIIPALVKAGVSALGAAIQSAASDVSSAPLVAVTSDSFYEASAAPDGNGPPVAIQPLHHCLGVIVTSAKAAAADPKGSAWLKHVDSPGQQAVEPADVMFQQLASTSLGRSDPYLPHLLAVWRLEYSADRTAFRLQPYRIIIGPAITDRGLRSRRRDLVLTIGMHLPAVNETDGAIGSATLMIPSIEGARAQSEAESGYLSTRWWPTPGLLPEAAGKLKSIMQRQEDLRALEDDMADPANAAKLPSLKARHDRLANHHQEEIRLFTATGALAPITVRVSVTETRQGSKLVAAIGKAIADQSEAVSTAIGNRLDPAKRQEASLAEFDKEADARLEAIIAVEEWQASLVEGKGVDSALHKAKSKCARAQDIFEYYVSQCTKILGGS